MATAQRIHFFSIKAGFRVRDQSRIRKLVNTILKTEKKKLEGLNFVFCSDTYLLAINQEWLGHDFYTDIITFNLAEARKPISGEIFISVDRIRDNAKKLGLPSSRELARVMIHGILHLCGYRDKTQKDQVRMRSREDFYLSRL